MIVPDVAQTGVYLFVGDSLTEGTYGESYVARIAAVLNQGGAQVPDRVVNAGVGADTLRAVFSRIGGLLKQHRPDWVILAIGVNDIWLPWLARHSIGWQIWLLSRRFRLGQVPTTDLDRFAALYRTVIGEIVDQAGCRMLACTTSCCGEQLASPPNRQLARLNGVIKDVAADCGVPVADVWQAFVEELAPLRLPSAYIPGEWLFTWMDRRRIQYTTPDEVSQRRRLYLTFDGIHLNSRGADLWARTILNTLAAAMAQDRP